MCCCIVRVPEVINQRCDCIAATHLLGRDVQSLCYGMSLLCTPVLVASVHTSMGRQLPYTVALNFQGAQLSLFLRMGTEL